MHFLCFVNSTDYFVNNTWLILNSGTRDGFLTAYPTPPPSLIDAWSCIWPTSLNQGNTLHSLFGAEIIFAIFFFKFLRCLLTFMCLSDDKR